MIRIAKKHIIDNDYKFKVIFFKNIYLSFIFFSLFSINCGLNTESDYNFDFINRFTEGKIFPDKIVPGTPNNKASFVLKNWEIGNQKRDVIIVMASGKISFDLPKNRLGERLFFGAGMKSYGDGAIGYLIINTEDGVIDTVYYRHLNPSVNKEDRKWFDESIDLSPFNNKRITITFSTDPGPNGDDTADWFAWSTPVLTFHR